MASASSSDHKKMENETAPVGERSHEHVQDEGEVEHEDEDSGSTDNHSAPPLPKEEIPPLPNEAPPVASGGAPGTEQDDGWAPVWDDTAQAYYFYNRFTEKSQWENPRVPDASAQPAAPGLGNYDRIATAPGSSRAIAPGTEETPTVPQPRPYGGYDPAIHGDYDPTAPYALEAAAQEEAAAAAAAQAAAFAADPTAEYTATGTFNRFTGRWQAATINPENHNDANKSKRQMNAFFDVDAAANSHNGKSLKAERSGKKLTKEELKAFKAKRKEKKEEKRRAWLRD